MPGKPALIGSGRLSVHPSAVGHPTTITASGERIVKSVARTLEVLEYFDEVQRPVNAAAVAGALGYPQSSTSALLRSMVALGYLDFDSRKRTYVPTDRVPLLGSWVNPRLFPEGALVKAAQAIATRSGQSALIGARNGDFGQYIYIANPNNVIPYHIRLGVLRPLGGSAIGNALLSAMRDSDVKRLFHRINAYRPEGSPPVDIKELLASLAELREKGFVSSRDQVAKGFGMIAMMLPPECTDRSLAIGIGAPSDIVRGEQDALVGLMREEIGRAFDHDREQGGEAAIGAPHLAPGVRSLT